MNEREPPRAAPIAEHPPMPTGLTVGAMLAHLRDRGVEARSVLPPGTAVAGVAIDSRKVRSGDVFVAISGSRAEGLEFAKAALASGAVAVVAATDAPGGPDGFPMIFVDDVAAAAGHLAALVAGEPAESLGLVGVTGTNGKTSCTYLLESVWRAAGLRCGVGGTINQRGPGFVRPAHLTTPDPVELQTFLRELCDAGAEWAAIEVSSHALAQQRIAGCTFRAAIFTNLTRDHLDYHADEESYFAAKLLLFNRYLRVTDGVAIINADDPRADAIGRASAPRAVVTYSGSGRANADVRVEADGDAKGAARGMLCAHGRRYRFASRLFGGMNLSNIAAVAAASIAIGIDPEAVVEGISTCDPVPGRFERVGDKSPAVFVDYAHTPDALERTLGTARDLASGRVIVVFGCGGDRDKGKRPVMGEIAGRVADIAVLTSDNPRGEDPAAIVAAIEEGVRLTLEASEVARLGADSSACGYLVEVDRERAIRSALALARPDDVVVVAGKGHEDYQEAAGQRRPFDDRDLTRRILEGG